MARRASGTDVDRSSKPEGVGSGDTLPPSSSEWSYTIGINLFQRGPGLDGLPTLVNLNEFPRDVPLPGVLLKSARTLLALPHATLATAAKVSKKTINDTENGFISPKAELSLRLRLALEAKGASFLCDANRMAVVTTSPREALPERSRSPRVNPGARMGEPAPGARPRGRPSKT